LAVASLLLVAFSSGRASAALANVPLEAEEYTPVKKAYVVNDADAFGSKAMRFDGHSRAHRDVDATGPISFFEVRARQSGGSCSNSLELLYRQKQADGTWGDAITLGTRTVTSSSYDWVQWKGLNIPGGDNRLILRNTCASMSVVVDYTDYSHDPALRAQLSDGLVLGVFGGNAHNGGSQDDGVQDYIADMGRRPSVVQTFMPFKWRGSYVGFPASGLDNVYANLQAPGGMAMMTWEPWDSSMGGCQSAFTNDAIINGNHDAHIRQYLTSARDWGKPIMIRFQHEVNGDWYAWSPNCYNNTPQKSAAAFRHVVNISREVGATNVKWMFAPHQESNIGGDNVHGGFSAFYPGDSYTDYVGLDVYNWASVRNLPWCTPVECATDDLNELRALGTDPVWIAESGTHEHYDGKKAAWFRDLRTLLKNEWSFVRGYVYFSNNQEGATFAINSSPESLNAYRDIE
jgi:hypothetical protein